MLNIPGIERKKTNKIEINANRNDNIISLKSKNLENFLFKEKRDKYVYPEDINNDYKSYNNNAVNISAQNDLENNKNKKYNENVSTRFNHNNINDKPITLNQKKYHPYEDPNFNNIYYNELGLKKGIQKINSKKIAFLGMTEKRSKLLFYDNKNGLKFTNNINSVDKKLNFKPLAEIKEKNNGKKRKQMNQLSLINNKNFSSLELRPNNNALTQNDVVMNDNNIILHIQKNLVDNKININDLKETRNKSTSGKMNNENQNNFSNNNNQVNLKPNEKSILKNKNKDKNLIDNLNINPNGTDSNQKIDLKKLTSKEKAFVILTQSKILQVPERIIFSRATENLKSLIPIKDIIDTNELFLKEKIKQAQLSLINYNKKIETPFTPSKTADISLNIIKTGDEDIFKNLLSEEKNLDEIEQKYYHTYICLLYILLGEDIKDNNFENINSNLLFDKLNKKGYQYLKDYLYLNFIKQHSNILNDDNKMKAFDELYVTLPDLIKHSGIIKTNKFICFSCFLIKEIHEYRKNLKQFIDVKNKTKAYIDVLKRKCPT